MLSQKAKDLFSRLDCEFQPVAIANVPFRKAACEAYFRSGSTFP